ncbi:hypothetical protein [Devosia sediminis]|uniref:Uncharacterized protein n=1 Tax=Devosia sediminis TaxID=2798801 RepID=A0A934MMJ5_9HYPH|nr:hypothetical protein [Devosia sediminis]MBJ3785776.1 hypothetical protein [Devosia sediminis]
MEQALKWRVGGWGLAGLLLLVPLLAMQVTDAVNWGAGDFLMAAVLLAATGVGLELVIRYLRDPRHRWIAGCCVVLVAVLVWAELAVGILP